MGSRLKLTAGIAWVLFARSAAPILSHLVEQGFATAAQNCWSGPVASNSVVPEASKAAVLRDLTRRDDLGRSGRSGLRRQLPRDH